MPELVLVAVTIVWGGSFLLAKHGLEQVDPFTFVALRFGVSTLVMLVLCGPRLRGLTRHEVKGGVLIGATLFAGYGLQTLGLARIPSSTSAFLTALYVPLVPLLTWLFTRRAPDARAWAGIVLAFAGGLLLSGGGAGVSGALTPGTGETLTIACAVATAGQILVIGAYAPGADPLRMTAVQLAVCAAGAAVCAPLAGEHVPEFSAGVLMPAGVLGLSTALVWLAITWAQRSVPVVRATIILAGEPLWAGVFGALAGERFAVASYAGAALVLAGLLVSSLKPARERSRTRVTTGARGSDRARAGGGTVNR
ncbi:DMT family transporter [Kineosporia sp. J2-2]|uniref:DMT family transporter n=1 Tax=Kineosporia corallincola TaxID=2835133 RepID=A0ABS5TSA5_9ACTN|nr:DMT family transporter [Kineosporia corallincola]MBT0773692.1 DMT family transporter [Kineosporia corallincola]